MENLEALGEGLARTRGDGEREVRAVRADLDAAEAGRVALEAALGLARGEARVGFGERRVARSPSRELGRIRGRGRVARGGRLDAGAAQDRAGRALAVRYRRDYRRGTAGRVAADVEAGPRALLGLGIDARPVAVESGAEALEEPAVRRFAHRGHEEVAVDGGSLVRGDRRAASRGVGLAEAHAPEDEPGGRSARRGRRPLGEGQGHEGIAGPRTRVERPRLAEGVVELLAVGRHLGDRAAVRQEDAFDARKAGGGPHRVHGGVAAAGHDDPPRPGEGGGRFEELEGVDDPHAGALHPHRAGHRRSGRGEEGGVALGLEGGEAPDFPAEAELGAEGLDARDVGGDVFARDAEARDDVGRHAAGRGGFVEDGDRDAGLGEIVRAGEAAGPGAYDGDLEAGRRARRPPRGDRRRLRAGELAGAYLHRPLVVVAAAGLLACVVAEGAGDEGQGIVLEDEGEGRGAVLGAGELDVAGGLLPRRAGLDAGGREAVGQGQGFRDAGLARLPGPVVLGTAECGRGEAVEGRGVGLGGRAGQGAEGLAGHREEAEVAARLEDFRGDGDGTDSRAEKLGDVGLRGAAAVGETLAETGEGRGEVGREAGRQGEEGPARHVALGAGQEGARVEVGEGVRELDPEASALRRGLGAERGDELEGVGELEVVLEALALQLDVGPAGPVEDFTGAVVAEEGGIELHVGVEALLLDEVGADALDLGGRAAVHRGEGDRVHGRVGEGREEGARPLEALAGIDAPEGRLAGGRAQEGFEVAQRVLPGRGGGGGAHALDEGVDLGALDAFEGVADRHVEEEGARLRGEEGAEEVDRDPAADVLGPGLLEPELGRPFDVVALVEGVDAGLLDVERVVLLHGLQLEGAGPREVGRDQAGRDLAVRPGGRTDGQARLAAHDLEARAQALELEGLAEGEFRYAVDGRSRPVLAGHPLEDGRHRRGAHYLAQRYPHVRKRPYPGLARIPGRSAAPAGAPPARPGPSKTAASKTLEPRT